MKKTLLIPTLLLLLMALLATGAMAETVTYTGTEATTVGATFTVKHESCGNPHAVCTVTQAATCSNEQAARLYGRWSGDCDLQELRRGQESDHPCHRP